jgi:hypothetical protein
MTTPPEISWPEGKSFAFTIFDDTDLATVENCGPVYDLLSDLDMRTTKSVWPLEGTGTPRVGGMTCEDPGYLTWVKELQQRGFEIGYHLATYHTSPRETTQRALDRFNELFGHDPVSMANHTGCEEGIYWGGDRISGMKRTLYRAALKWRGHPAFRGHVEGDPLFWGDLCGSHRRKAQRSPPSPAVSPNRIRIDLRRAGAPASCIRTSQRDSMNTARSSPTSSAS